MRRTFRGMFIGSVVGSVLAVGIGAVPGLAEANGTDQEIVSQLHLANQLAIETATLGEARAGDQRVSAFAAAMAQDHRLGDVTLLTYAELKQMNMGFVNQPGAALPAHDALALAELRQSPANRFDYDFATKVVSSQQAVIDEAENARKIARDPALRGIIESALQGMRERLAAAQGLAHSVPEPTPGVVASVPPAGP